MTNCFDSIVRLEKFPKLSKKHKASWESRERNLESEAPETDLNILVNGENGHRINPTVTRFLRQQKVEQLTHSGGFIGYTYLPQHNVFYMLINNVESTYIDVTQ